MDIKEELEIEEMFLSEERTTLIYMITGASYAALGLLLKTLSEDYGLQLIVSTNTIVTTVLSWVLILGGLLVAFIQIPKLIKEEKQRSQFEKNILDKDLKEEIKKKKAV